MGMKAGKESDLVRQCLDWLALHRVKAWRSNNGGVYDPVRKRFRTFHGLKGVADILGIIARRAYLQDGTEEVFGILLAVEVKRPGEKLRPEQEAFLNDVRRLGGVGLCVHSLAELEEGMEALNV